MTPQDRGPASSGVLDTFTQQARELTRLLGELQELEADVTAPSRLVTVRVTAAGAVRSISIRPSARRIDDSRLGEIITETTNQAFAAARSIAQERLGEHHAAQRALTEQLRRHSPAAADALSELTAGPAAGTAEASEPADDASHRPWSVLE